VKVANGLLLILVLTLFIGSLGLKGGDALAAELRAVEKLTEIEILQLKEAKDAAREANRKLQEVQDRIAIDHKMKGESWMEWSSWYEINGEFIFYYYRSNMQQFILR